METENKEPATMTTGMYNNGIYITNFIKVGSDLEAHFGGGSNLTSCVH